MKRMLFSQMARITVGAAMLGAGAAAFAQTGEVVVPRGDKSCDRAVAEMTAAIRGDKGILLSEYSGRITASPWCACQLTKAAIQTVDASKQLVGEIVYHGTLAAPEQYKVIATCALEVAPDAAEEIRLALLKAFGENGEEGLPSSGKGKVVAVKSIRVEEPTTTSSPVERRPAGFVNNVFIIPPAGHSASPPTPPKPEPPTSEPPKPQPPRKPPVPSPPSGTDSDPLDVDLGEP